MIDLPGSVQVALAGALGSQELTFQPLGGGTNERTFLVEREAERWVVRLEPADSLQLRRAVAAQQMAKAAGVRVPRIVADDFRSSQSGDYVWMLEEHVAGDAFEVPLLPPQHVLALSYELGRQLRSLHAIPVDAFGLIAPEPYGTFTSFAGWIDHEAGRIGRAFAVAGIAHEAAAPVREHYALLRAMYDDRARLCHGDCSGSNLIVADRRVTLIDWEWARGADPAWNIGYWFFWHQDQAALGSLLQGYQPADPERLWRRIMAYEIFLAVGLILVYEDQAHAEGIRFARRRLSDALGVDW
jgi:aminoglycoside phosphotransferase (APT) family kinase protein